MTEILRLGFYVLIVNIDAGWRGNFLLSAAEQWLKLELTVRRFFRIRYLVFFKT